MGPEISCLLSLVCAALVAISGPKKARISEPNPSNDPRYGFLPHPNPHVPPHINNRYINSYNTMFLKLANKLAKRRVVIVLKRPLNIIVC
jgi:hypothetical protein